MYRNISAPALPVLLAGACLLAGLGPLSIRVARGAEVDGPAILDRMRAFDQAIQGPFTLRVDSRMYRRSEMPEQGIVDVHTTLTSNGSDWAMESESSYESDPVFHPPADPYTAADYDDDGNLLVWRDDRSRTLVSPGLAGTLTEMTLYRVGPDGRRARPETGSPAILLFAPEEAADFVNTKVLFWAAGRGFAGEVQELGRAEAMADGLVRIEGAGSQGNVSGTWVLQVDPSSAYLVRDASFTPDHQGAPLFVFHTRGTQNVQDWTIPESADYSLGGERPEAMVHAVLRGFSRSVDARVLSEAQSRLNGPYPPGAHVTDYRDRSAGARDVQIRSPR